MKHIFKANTSGAFSTADGVSYDCKCVNSSVAIPKGWSDALEKVLAKVKKAEKVIAKEPAPVQAEIEG